MHVYKYTCTSVYVRICNKGRVLAYIRKIPDTTCTCAVCARVCGYACGQPKGLAESGREEGKVIVLF